MQYHNLMQSKWYHTLLLLGTVTPSLAKYAMSNLGEADRTVGLLGAFNTVGSIIGTFLPTFS